MKLFIKGPPKSAKREAARRGIPVHNCRAMATTGASLQRDRKTRSETVCETNESSSNLVKVMQWFGKTAVNVPGRGYAPGELLFFNGAKRRRRRR